MADVSLRGIARAGLADIEAGGIATGLSLDHDVEFACRRLITVRNFGHSPGDATHHLAETSPHLADGSCLNYAWGVRITPASYGRLITHGGTWQTWHAKTVRVPERQVAVAVLSVGATEQAVSDVGIRLAQALASR